MHGNLEINGILLGMDCMDSEITWITLNPHPWNSWNSWSLQPPSCSWNPSSLQGCDKCLASFGIESNTYIAKSYTLGGYWPVEKLYVCRLRPAHGLLAGTAAHRQKKRKRLGPKPPPPPTAGGGTCCGLWFRETMGLPSWTFCLSVCLHNRQVRQVRLRFS